ncbi:hypothetical protein [Abyssisolibacter fermentans]|uniref:hypothetical protein n=1 Tax=Abyssisolibacter fermentans TaxID=1766203 RepID=UPI00082FA545|nr:hypothetical protein [Abyssisolibacter fermentans]
MYRSFYPRLSDRQGKDYRVYVYEGPVAKIENALVVISYEVDGDGFKNPIYLISTDIELDSKTIINYYSKRWTIEAIINILNKI